MKNQKALYEELGKELDIKRYRLDTSWKVKSLLKVIPKQTFNSIIEVGCGGALVLKGVSAAHNSRLIIGLDISKAMLDIARTESEACLVRADAEYLPLKDNSVDLVILSDIIEHVESISNLLREAQRIGKFIAFKIPLEKCFRRKGVKLGCGNHASGHLYSWSKEDAISLLSQNGITLQAYALVEPPSQIRFYKKHPWLSTNIVASVLNILEPITYKLARPLYRYLYGSTLVAFARVNHGKP